MTSNGQRAQAYRESLPEDCPPVDATLTEEGVLFYRLARTDPPTDRDFDSWREQHPGKPLPYRISECRARSVSVFQLQTAIDRLRKLPRFRNQVVCELKLSAQSGKLQQTGQDPAHYSWWPFADFNILGACKVIS